MGKPRRAKKTSAAAPLAPSIPVGKPGNVLAGWKWAAVLAFVVLVFYWPPLTSPKVSIQWDAVDVHYSPQKYFADSVRRGELPFWTPYIYSGFPFLADPQVGAWYPLNWPFFLMGITPRMIQIELVLHAFLACAGTLLLLRRLIGNPAAALLGACVYGLSGFFAGHSSHVGIFSAASLFPWLLLTFDLGAERSFLRFAGLGGLTGGCLILAGHLQTALYAWAGLALFAVAEIARRPRIWKRAVGFLALALTLAVGLSSIQTLPALELAHQSLRAGADYGGSKEGVLEPRSLLTLLFPNALGAISGSYTGPADVTQHYFYAGFLLLPLAIAGLREPRLRAAAAALLIPTLWYMLGPAAGLYRAGAILPWFHKVRAPVHGWFLAGFALALLAAAGAQWVTEHWKRSFVPLALLAVTAADLCYWNSWHNPLAYARASFDELYGRGLDLARSRVAPSQPPMTRLDGPDRLNIFGPMNHPLDLRLEATYGYNPLALTAYTEYRAVMEANPKLRDALTVSRYLDTKAGAVRPNPTVLPRAMFSKEVVDDAGAADSRRLLATSDPTRQVIVQPPYPAIRQDAQAVITEIVPGEQEYRIRYRASTPSLLRLSVPYYPGWQATAGGSPCPVVRVDHALLGVVVPAGKREVSVSFRSTHFATGAALSLVSLLAGLALCRGDGIRRKNQAVNPITQPSG